MIPLNRKVKKNVTLSTMKNKADHIKCFFYIHLIHLTLLHCTFRMSFQHAIKLQQLSSGYD